MSSSAAATIVPPPSPPPLASLPASPSCSFPSAPASSSSTKNPSTPIPRTPCSCGSFRPLVFPIAAAPFAQKYFSINLDTHVPEEQDHLEVSPFQASLPLRSPRAVSLTVKLCFERHEGSTSSARFSPLTRGLTFGRCTARQPHTPLRS